MSRVASNPVVVPAGIDVDIVGQQVAVKGAKGALELTVHRGVEVVREEGTIKFAPRDGSRISNALAGTTRALVNNMVVGVSQGFTKQLKLVGVGYRAQAKGNTLNLHLGFSHPVDFSVPDGIKIDTPSPTDIVVSGIDKQQVGQVAANIRAYRSPEPYKGKGVRYADEMVRLKEAKKK